MKSKKFRVFLAVMVCMIMVTSNFQAFAEEIVTTDGGNEPTVKSEKEAVPNDKDEKSTVVESPGGVISNTMEENPPVDNGKPETVTRDASFVPAGSGLDVDINLIPREKNQDGSPKFTYLTGSMIDVYNSVSVSGEDVNLVSPYIVVTIPKKNVSTKPEASTASSLDSVTVTSNEEKDAWEIKYVYKALVGGQSVSIPFNFKHDNYNTQGGFETTIKQEMFTEDGTKLGETSKTFTAEVTKQRIAKTGGDYMGGFPSASDPSIIDPDRTTPVRFGLLVNTSSGNFGYGTLVGSMRLFDVLPPGARLSNVPGNEGWKYDAENHLAYKDLNLTNPNGRWEYIYLDFPGYKLNTTHVNTAALARPDLNGTMPSAPGPDDAVSKVNFRLLPTQYITLRKSPSPSSVSMAPEFKDKVVHWTIKGTFNVEGRTQHITEIGDKLEDTHLQYTKFQLKLPPSISMSDNVLLGYDEAGKEEVIATNILANTDYPVDKKYRRITLRMKDPLEVPSKKEGDLISAIVSTNFNPDTWGSPPMLGWHHNSAEIKYYSDSPSTTLNATVRNGVYVSPYNPQLYTNGSTTTPTRYVDQIGNLRFFVSYTGYAVPGTLLKNPKFVVLLPEEGVEYVPGSAKLNDQSIVPILIPNYKKSGKSALIYQHQGDFIYPKRQDFTFQVLFTREAKEGPNVFKSYMTNDTDQGNPYTWNGSSKTADVLDINENGDTKDFVGTNNATINFIPPQELIGTIKVDNSDGSFGKASDGVDIGGEVQYKIRLENKTLSDIGTATAINVLPTRGDKAIVKNIDGDYVDRNSQFDVDLTGPITAPAGFTITYSTETPAADALDVNQQNFVTADQVTDWSKVTMFKVVMDPGTVISPGKNVEITYKGKVEDNSALAEGANAYNSFAYSNTNKAFIECTSASAPIVKYHVDGTIFLDKDKDGIMDGTDDPLGGYTLSLVDTETGAVITALTDSQGKYAITSLNRGKYKVALTKKSIDTITSTGSGTGIVNDMDPTTGETQEFTLMPATNKATFDGGVYRDHGMLEIYKTDEKNQPLGNVVFELLDTVTNTVIQLQTGADGKVSFNGLIYDRLYKLTEKSAPEGYYVPDTATDIMATLDNSIIEKSFTNRIIKGAVEVTVVDKEDHSILLEGAKVKLQKVDGEGNPVGEPIQLTTDAQGKASFTDLTYGDYVITQMTTAEGYVLNDKPLTIQIREDGVAVLAVIENDKIPVVDEKTGTKAGTVKAKKEVKTGDDMNLLYPGILLLTSLLVIAVSFATRRRGQRE